MKNKLIIISSIIISISIITLLTISYFYGNNGYIEIEKAKNDNEIVVVDFWSEGCKPCVRVSEIMDEISEEYKTIEVIKVDINAEDDLHMKYEIIFVPTVIIFYKGQEFARIVGFHEKYEYTRHIDYLINPNEANMIKFEW